MKQRLLAAVMAAMIALAPAQQARALFGFGVVFDPQNFAQNVMTAANTLQQINNQIAALQNQSQMILHQARNLQNMPFSVGPDLQASLYQIDNLIRTANGLAYQISAIEAQYQNLFPEQYSTAVSSSQIIQDAQQAWRQSRDGYRHALHVQASVMQQVRSDNAILNSLVSASQGATGNLQAAQASNQLTAFAAKQTMQLQTLMAASARAEALEQARSIAAREQARARFRNFLGDGNPYTRS